MLASGQTDSLHPSADLARHVGRCQASYFGSGVKPEGPKPEAQTADSKGGILGMGKLASSPTARGLGGTL